MNTQGPYDRDPPWSEGPPPEPERCANCGTERFESDVTGCGGCGFTWQEIDNAVRIVRAITRELCITLTDEQRHKAIDATLGELVPGVTMKATTKKKRTFADIDAARKRYDPEVEGYGSAEDWTGAFHARMGFEEAQEILHGGNKTPRQILGIGKSATWAEITKAYRAKAVACHPDRIGVTGMTLEGATEALKKVNAAYSVLAREFGK